MKLDFIDGLTSHPILVFGQFIYKGLIMIYDENDYEQAQLAYESIYFS